MSINNSVLVNLIASRSHAEPNCGTFSVTINDRKYFVKKGNSTSLSIFEAEAEILEEISNLDAISVPKVMTIGIADEFAYLILEWLDLAPLSYKAAAKLGEGLSVIHRTTAEQFGWHCDNTIGLTPQINRQSSEWIDFWKKNRLGFQLKLAANNGYVGRLQELGQQLLEDCSVLFSGYRPVPSLLHGDLWHGNAACINGDQPVIYDPAGYYGDREADLAMATLFGGFPQSFFSAYEASWPLDAGYQVRREFYNIYHLLNHLNLFGGSYLHQTEKAMEAVLSSVR